MAVDSRWRDLFRDLKSQGWRIESTKGVHFKLIPPGDGQIVVVAGTPSDHRAFANTKSRCRKSGADL